MFPCAVILFKITMKLTLVRFVPKLHAFFSVQRKFHPSKLKTGICEDETSLHEKLRFSSSLLTITLCPESHEFMTNDNDMMKEEKLEILNMKIAQLASSQGVRHVIILLYTFFYLDCLHSKRDFHEVFSTSSIVELLKI